MTEPVFDDKATALVDLISRTGAKQFQIRFCDEEQPVVWIAVASYERDGTTIHEAAGAMTPPEAVGRLAEQLVDGGQCVHCKRPAGVEWLSLNQMPLSDAVCWYQYDPELKTFRRGCE